MPTYEYECQNCGHRFEKFEAITSKPVSKCPLCGDKCKRLISAGGGVIFKGSGFYQTDYRSDSYKKAEKADKAQSGTASEVTSEKTETKAEAEAK